MIPRLVLGTVIVTALASPVLRAQTSATSTTLRVTGDVQTSLALSVADLKAMPRSRVALKDADRAMTYEGVLVSELLKRAGVPLGADLRGPVLATYVVASAPDGYQVVFSLGELDPALSGHDVLVADTLDGQPLAPTQGPMRLVAPRDTRPARSVRMLERLDVVRLRAEGRAEGKGQREGKRTEGQRERKRDKEGGTSPSFPFDLPFALCPLP